MPMRLLSLMILLFGFTLTIDAKSQVYRCNEGGQISFSDHPCPTGATETKKNYAASGGAGDIDVNVSMAYYDVTGKDHDSLLRSMSAKGPQGFHGLTHWDVHYTFHQTKQGDTCQISTVHVVVSGQIMIPRWVDEATAPADLRTHWVNYIEALKRHEEGHMQNGKDLAVQVRQGLLGLGSMPCNQTNAAAQKEYDRIYDSMKTRDQDYDARTNHGITQGAQF